MKNNSGSKSGSFDRTIAPSSAPKSGPRKSNRNLFGYQYPSVDLQVCHTIQCFLILLVIIETILAESVKQCCEPYKLFLHC